MTVRSRTARTVRTARIRARIRIRIRTRTRRTISRTLRIGMPEGVPIYIFGKKLYTKKNGRNEI